MSKLKSVLIIDDDAFNLILLERVFKKRSLAGIVLTAANGEEAIEKISEIIYNKGDMPQLILLDVNMPVMNGIEFLKTITSIIDPIPFKIFVMLTTNLPMSFNDDIIKNLITDYVDKPLTEDVIKGIIESHFI